MQNGAVKVLRGEETAMTKGERTRQHIIEAAAPIFNQRGYNGCSISEIMEATGLEKGGIYRHFENKEALAEEVLRSSLRQAVRLHTPDLERAKSAREKILLIVDHFVNAPSTLPGGCPLMNAAVDSDDGSVPLRRLVKRAFADWRARLTCVLEEGARNGEFTSVLSAAQLADTIIAALEGAQVMSRVQGSPEPLKNVQTVLHLLIDSIAAPRNAVRKKPTRRAAPRR